MTNAQKLRKQSEGAISAVVSLINGLRLTNEAIDNERMLNDSKIKELHATQKDLETLKSDNIRIINNFEGLLK